MRICFLFLVLLICPVSVNSQESRHDEEKDAVRRVVETYLYAEEGEERKRTLFDQAKVLTVDPSGRRITETAISKSSPKRKGEKVRSKQKIVSIDVVDGGAMVKVETDLSSEGMKIPKHMHYLSLLKANGEWKIVSAVMPPVKMKEEGSDETR